MTQISYVWNGIITGDATTAPYTKEPFNQFIMGIHLNDLDTAYVVPGYLDDLDIRAGNPTGGFFVTVATGAAIYGNYAYINDTELSFPLEQIATAGFFRYDLIVIRKDSTEQTVRIALLKGVETNAAYTLFDPTVAPNECILARIYVDDSNAYLADKYVYDQRMFATSNYSLGNYGNYQNNLLVNSEYMAFSSSDGSNPPEFWDTATRGSSTITESVKLSNMSRGRSLVLTDESMFQDFRFLRGLENVFTVKGTFLTTAEGGTYTFTLKQRLGNDIRVQEFISLPNNELVEFQFTVTYTGEDQGLRLEVTNAGGGLELGQIIVVPGYHPGPFRQFNEHLPFYEAVPDANWTATAKSSAITSIDLSASFGSKILDQTKAVILRLKGNDSGSAAGAPSLTALGYYTAPASVAYGQLELDGITNDVSREVNCTIPVNQSTQALQDQTPRFRLEVVATGAGTFDATVEVIGVIT
jgi:hypothetical protein